MTHCQWYWKRVERTARRSHDPLYGTDLPDLQFVRKEVCRGTSAPTEQSWKKAKRIVRYLLLGRETVHWPFPWSGHGGWQVLIDSDWASIVGKSIV